MHRTSHREKGRSSTLWWFHRKRDRRWVNHRTCSTGPEVDVSPALNTLNSSRARFMNTGEERFTVSWTHAAFWTPAGPGAPAASHLYVSRLICLLVVGTPYLLSTIKLGLLYRGKAKSESDCGDGDDFKDVFSSILDCREMNCVFVSAARQVEETRNCNEVQMEEIIWSTALFCETGGLDTQYGLRTMKPLLLIGYYCFVFVNIWNK